MKHKFIVLFLLFVIVCWPLSYGSSKNLSLEAAYTSGYIWRGFDLLPNNHSAVQPSFTYKFGESGLWINFWSSFGINERKSTKSADELDYSIGYDIPFGDGFVDVSTGLMYYTYPNLPGENTSPEIFISLLLSKVDYSPLFTAYYDMNLGTGLYIVGSISKSINLLPLSFGLSVGFNDYQYVEDSGISDIVLSCSNDLKIGNVTLSPSLNYAFVLMDKVNNENEFWASIGFTF